MSEAKLIRYIYDSDGCFGMLVVAGKPLYYTCENRWLGNKSNISCIPVGTYILDPLVSSASGKYKNCYWVRSVPGRAGILIHSGNYPSHTRGCILPGKRLWLNTSLDKYMVTSSKLAMRELWRAKLTSLRVENVS